MADSEDTATLVHSFTLVSLLAASALYGNVLLRVPKALPGSDETYRARCHTYVSTSIMGSFLEAIMAIFSIGSCVTFVWETYLTGQVRSGGGGDVVARRVPRLACCSCGCSLGTARVRMHYCCCAASARTCSGARAGHTRCRRLCSREWCLATPRSCVALCGLAAAPARL